MKIRSVSEFLDDFERSGLLSLDAIRIYRVDDGDPLEPAEFANEPQGIIEIAAQGDYFCAIKVGLNKFSAGDLAGGEKDRAEHARPGRIGRRSRRSVAGGGADHRGGSLFESLGNRDRHSAILEGTGGVQRLIFDENLGFRAFTEARRVDQRGRALAQRNNRRRVGNGKVLPESTDDPAIMKRSGDLARRGWKRVGQQILGVRF